MFWTFRSLQTAFRRWAERSIEPALERARQGAWEFKRALRAHGVRTRDLTKRALRALGTRIWKLTKGVVRALEVVTVLVVGAVLAYGLVGSGDLLVKSFCDFFARFSSRVPPSCGDQGLGTLSYGGAVFGAGILIATFEKLLSGLKKGFEFVLHGSSKLALFDIALGFFGAFVALSMSMFSVPKSGSTTASQPFSTTLSRAPAPFFTVSREVPPAVIRDDGSASFFITYDGNGIEVEGVGRRLLENLVAFLAECESAGLEIRGFADSTDRPVWIDSLAQLANQQAGSDKALTKGTSDPIADLANLRAETLKALMKEIKERKETDDSEKIDSLTDLANQRADSLITDLANLRAVRLKALLEEIRDSFTPESDRSRLIIGDTTWSYFAEMAKHRVSGRGAEIRVPSWATCRGRMSDLAVVGHVANRDSLETEGPITFTSRVQNRGPNEARNVTLEISLPAGAEVVDTSQDVRSVPDGSVILWTIDSLPRGETATRKVEIKPPRRARDTRLRSVAFVRGQLHDPFPSNNSLPLVIEPASRRDIEETSDLLKPQVIVRDAWTWVFGSGNDDTVHVRANLNSSGRPDSVWIVRRGTDPKLAVKDSLSLENVRFDGANHVARVRVRKSSVPQRVSVEPPILSTSQSPDEWLAALGATPGLPDSTRFAFTAKIDTAGFVEAGSVSFANLKGSLRDAATQWLEDCRFQPAQLHGHPVVARIEAVLILNRKHLLQVASGGRR